MKLFVVILVLATVACALPLENLEVVESQQLDFEPKSYVASDVRNKRAIENILRIKKLLGLKPLFSNKLPSSTSDNQVSTQSGYRSGGFGGREGGSSRSEGRYRTIIIERIQDDDGKIGSGWERYAY